MRANIMKEKYSGGISRHFGIDKTMKFIVDIYYWPQIYKDV